MEFKFLQFSSPNPLADRNIRQKEKHLFEDNVE